MPRKLLSSQQGRPASSSPHTLYCIPYTKYYLPAFSVVEILLSVSILAIIAMGLMSVLIVGQQGTSTSGERARATLLAEEGLEAVRNLRDGTFTNLINGTYGLAISNGKWILSGSSDTTGIFTRQITIATLDTQRKQITSTVTWQQTPQRTGTIILTSTLTNWNRIVPTPTPTSTPNDPLGLRSSIAHRLRSSGTELGA